MNRALCNATPIPGRYQMNRDIVLFSCHVRIKQTPDSDDMREITSYRPTGYNEDVHSAFPACEIEKRHHFASDFTILRIRRGIPSPKRDAVISLRRRPTESSDGQMEFVNSRACLQSPLFARRQSSFGLGSRWGSGPSDWACTAGQAFKGSGSAAKRKVAETKNLCSMRVSLSVVLETPGSQPAMTGFLQH